MLYQLPNGKVIELSLDQYLDMSDEELESIISYNFGHEIESPFFGSILEKPGSMILEEDIEEFESELPDIPEDEKLGDDYFHRDDT
jgi:hypothetical protein